MNSISISLQDKINIGLARALGFVCHSTPYTAGRVHQVWESPFTSWYYRELSVPDFCNGWTHMQMLVKAMERIGYGNFKLMKLGKSHWISSFACNKGPCTDHGTDFHNWHGAQDVFGENPGQAAAFAAVKAIATGTRVSTKETWKENGVLKEATTHHNLNVDDIAEIVKIVDGHSAAVIARRYPHLKGAESYDASDESTVRPS